VRDPILGRDAAFYVFRLPFLELVQGLLLATVTLAAIGAFAGHVASGNLALGGPLRAAGYEVRIIDAKWEPDYQREIRETVGGAVCFGVTGLTGYSVCDGLEMSGLVKAKNPEIPVVWGGWQSSFAPAQAIEDPRIDVVVKGRPQGLVVAGANPRHEHEWKVWKQVRLPAGKVLVAGVIDSTTNFIEHTELVAERIVRYAGVVGRENVVAGVDCGFGTFAGRVQVDTNIVWHKLRALVEGARLASEELW